MQAEQILDVAQITIGLVTLIILLRMAHSTDSQLPPPPSQPKQKKPNQPVGQNDPVSLTDVRNENLVKELEDEEFGR